ncbi:MAG: guanylate kinase, partial [Bergeyella zoohelcum]|nr:guanylate kinase [Bergeyella zoohelcum]
EFRQKISENAFVEYEEVYTDKYYGTLKTEVERIWNEGKIVIFDVDVKGGVSLKNYFGEKAMSVFIMPPSVEELERRLIGRNTDDAETIKTRVAKAEEELAYQKFFDEIIINDDLEIAKKTTENLVKTFSEK